METTCLRRLRIFGLSISILTAFSPACAWATEDDAQAWFVATARIPIDDRFSGILEGHARLADDASRLSATQLRAGVAYSISPALKASGGYWHVWTYRENAPDTEENRFWQDLTWKPGQVAGHSLSLRTRLEQSFPAGGGETGWRFREQLKVTRPLRAGSPVYLYGSGETFFNLVGTERADAGFEQIRFSAGGGFPVQEQAHVEIGYLNQYQQRHGTEDRMNHVLLLTLVIEP